MPGMLVLKRFVEERIVITVAGKTVEVVLCSASRDCARLGFTADADVVIMRKELLGRPGPISGRMKTTQVT